MKRSIFARTLMHSAGMVLLSILVLSLVASMVSYTFVVDERRDTMDSTALVMENLASAIMEISDLNDWQLGLQAISLARATGFRILLCDREGQVVVCSDALLQCEHIGRSIGSEALLQVQQKGSYRKLSDLGGFYARKQFVSARPLALENGAQSGYVFVTAETRVAGQMWRSYTLVLLFAGLLVLLLLIPISVRTSRKEAAPLRELVAAARQFAKGELRVRVRTDRRSDEVGELCEAFNQMAESLEQAEQQRKDFIASVSHELKTPMTTISGFADGMLDGTISPAESEKYLTIISDETKRLNRLVRQMLDISRMKPPAGPANSAFDISEVLRRNILNLERKIEERQLELRPELPEDVLLVRGQGDEVGRVFYNILENAIKFADPGTALDVGLFKQGSKVYVSVVDRGETIPESDLPHIFERFHKSDRSRSLDRDGVGLGLYIVKTILNGMREDIWVRSLNGETEFRFSLTRA